MNIVANSRGLMKSAEDKKSRGEVLRASSRGWRGWGGQLLPEDEWEPLCLLAPGPACVHVRVHIRAPCWTGVLEERPATSHAQVDKLRFFQGSWTKTHCGTVWPTADTVERKHGLWRSKQTLCTPALRNSPIWFLLRQKGNFKLCLDFLLIWVNASFLQTDVYFSHSQTSFFSLYLACVTADSWVLQN